MHYLNRLVSEDKSERIEGIVSICSANAYVLKAAMINAKKYSEHVLIEATANQVNQFGGYTGMRPMDFISFVYGIADAVGFDKQKIILGGDHLGPLTWAKETEKEAMGKAETLVEQFVLAGFTKIHLDTSMKLADDGEGILADETIARRGARLCQVCEQAYQTLVKQKIDAQAPVYIVGSEVPIPGGAQEEETLSVTRADDLKNTYHQFKENFYSLGLEDAWDRVLAIVVQPGVEFGDASIHEYDRQKAKALIDAASGYKDIVLEGHSTDYQTKYKLRQMVEDGIKILKVGPALTYAFREALFSLELIEKEICLGQSENLSNFRQVLTVAMNADSSNWIKHYHGDNEAIQQKLMFSFSDRARYYMPNKAVEGAIERLVKNLSDKEIAPTLLSQFIPIQYTKVREGLLENKPEALLMDRIVQCLDEYGYACGRILVD